MPKEIEILARGALVKNGKLLVCRNRRKGNIFLPGGHVEFGETSKAALRREIREEMGVAAVVGDFVGVAEHCFIYKGRRICEINLVFKMEIRGVVPERPVPSAEKNLEFVWLSLSTLSKTRFEPGVLRKLLPGWVKSRKTECWVGFRENER